jgi:GNAT superfamily N-acetyltransferase
VVDVTFSPIGTEPAAVSAAVRLLNGALGDGIYSEPGLVEMAGYDRALGLAAWLEGDLVGAAVAQALVPDDNAYYDAFGPRAHDRLAGRHLGSLEASVVAEDHRGAGIGRELAQRRMAWAAGLGSEIAVGIAWMSSPSPSWPLFEGMGFELLGESDQIYTTDSIENGWSCPVCGNPCHCTGRLYAKDL